MRKVICRGVAVRQVISGLLRGLYVRVVTTLAWFAVVAIALVVCVVRYDCDDRLRCFGSVAE